MIHTMLLAAAQTTVPATPAWSPSIGIVMVVFNLLGLFIARSVVRRPTGGPSLPGNLSLPILLAGTSFGHILGTGAILGLTNAGIL